MNRAGLNDTRVDGEAIMTEATAIIEAPMIVLVPYS